MLEHVIRKTKKQLKIRNRGHDYRCLSLMPALGSIRTRRTRIHGRVRQHRPSIPACKHGCDFEHPCSQAVLTGREQNSVLCGPSLMPWFHCAIIACNALPFLHSIIAGLQTCSKIFMRQKCCSQ